MEKETLKNRNLVKRPSKHLPLPPSLPRAGGPHLGFTWTAIPPLSWVMTSLCNFLEEVVDMIFQW